jgi:hypothetical protein
MLPWRASWSTVKREALPRAQKHLPLQRSIYNPKEAPQLWIVNSRTTNNAKNDVLEESKKLGEAKPANLALLVDPSRNGESDCVI